MTPAPTAGGLVARGAQLAGLWALAVARPFFETTESGEVFVLAGWRGADVVALALGVAFGPPALMLLIEALAGRVRPRLGELVHVVFVGAIAAIFAAYVVKDQTDLASAPSLAIAIVAGVAAGRLFTGFEPVRLFCTVIGPASLLVVGLFLFGSPIRHLVFPSDGADLTGPRPAAPVVMIVFDEFPTLSLLDGEGKLDEAAYPAFARLARDGTWYRNATTVSDHTTAAVPSILTGRHEDGDRPASVSAHPDNLLALLGGRGGATAIESLTRLCPRDVCAQNEPRPLPGRFTRPLPALAKLSLAEFVPDALYKRLPATDPLPLERAEDGFGRFDASLAGSRATIHYLHVQLPHAPWVRAPSGRRLGGFATDAYDFLPHLPRVPLATGLPTLGEVRWTEDPRRVAHMVQRHLLQVRAADRRLGQTLDRLRAAGLYDEALVVVTADHGVAFDPGADARRLARATAPGILHVPLFVKLPGRRRGTVSDAFVQSIDIAPTVADALGLRLPWKPDGRSALAPAPERSRLVVHSFREERMEFDARSLAGRMRAEAVRRAASLHGTDPGRIYRAGPHGFLVHRRLSALRTGAPSALRYRLAGPRSSLDFDPASGVVPAVISGWVAGPRATGREVAVVLNGRVGATARTHPSATGARFDAIVPEELLRPGPNRLELFEIGPGARLAPIGPAAS